MAEVAFRKVLRIKLGQQQYFLLETERGGNIVDHPSTLRAMSIV
jgi:hypothetical protein